MIALLLLSGVIAGSGPTIDRGMVIMPPGENSPRCKAIAEKVRGDQAAYFQRLGYRRGGARILHYAVERKIDGCGVPAPAGYRMPEPVPPPRYGK